MPQSNAKFEAVSNTEHSFFYKVPTTQRRGKTLLYYKY